MSKQYKYFKIGLASPEEIKSWSHGEVLNHETINYRTLKPENGGLFCEKIFGPQKDYVCGCGKVRRSSEKGKICEKCLVEITESKVRRERMGHISLAAPVVHAWFLRNSPSPLATLLNIKNKDLQLVVNLQKYIVIEPGMLKNKKDLDMYEGKILDEGEYDFLSDEYPNQFKALTGAEAIEELLKKVDLESLEKELRRDLKDKSKQSRNDAIKRLEIVEAFLKSDNKPEWMVLRVLPVLPPAIRPMVPLDGGRFATTDLNDLYRRIINRNNRLKELLEKNAPSIILKNEKRMLQEAVDSLIDNSKRGNKSANNKAHNLKSLSDMLRGKQGRFRQNLLGKRVDYSGRSVIVVGPSLKMYQCGVPREMALTLFQPFVLRRLIKDYNYSIAIAKKKCDHQEPEVWPILEGVVREHPVLLNRAPTLHRLGIQAFEPVLIEGKAIRLHPLVCTPFNADFDGDQMAIHVPLSIEAQAEARLLMLASNNILNPRDGKPVVTPSQDMILGNYYLTSERRYKGKAGRYTDAKSKEVIDNGQAFAKYVDAKKAKKDEKTLAKLINEAYEEYINNKDVRAEEENEGHFYKDFDEAYMAYKNGAITLHTRIFVDITYMESKFRLQKLNAEAIELELSKKRNEIQDKKYSEVEVEREIENYRKELVDHQIKSNYLFTTMGKMIFNKEILPEDFAYLNEPTDENLTKKYTPVKYFLDRNNLETSYRSLIIQPETKPFNKKFISRIIAEVFKRYQITETSKLLDRIKDVGYHYSTVSGISISMEDVPNFDIKEKRMEEARKKCDEIQSFFEMGLTTNKERYQSIVQEWNSCRDEIEKTLYSELSKREDNSIFMMADSGSRGSSSNFSQLAGMRGLMSDTAGNTIEVPVKANFREGLSVSEFFISTHGARKGSTDTALKTAESGYLTRRLVDVSQSVVISEEDCGTERGFFIEDIVEIDKKKERKVITRLEDRIVGRYAAKNIVVDGEIICKRNELIDENVASIIRKYNDKIEDDIKNKVAGVDESKKISKVCIRSVLTCTCKTGVCKMCYGRNLATNMTVEVGEAVGTIAAQAIGEPGTQLTMRTFHSGGVAGADITQGLPRVQELFEARRPKGQAKISEIDGIVDSIQVTPNKTGKEIKIINEKTGETFTTKVDATSELLVQEKDKVSRGDKLIVGSIDPKELLKVKDVVTVEKYILDEVLKVYKSQNVDISDKHIEIIIRQMLRKIAVLNEGDTNLIPGRNVSVNTFSKAIDEAIAENGELPVGKQLILGITKAALGSDSFLAAASFQETTRVLTQAAIEGKYDTLQGLKENTLIGGLIPAGTGILEEESFECKHRPEDEMLDDDNNNSEGSNAFELYSEPTDETSDTPTGDYEETSIDEL